MWLCSGDDVAVELGLPSEAAMPAPTLMRAEALIDRVSTLFAVEAGRPFAAGTYSNRIRPQYDSAGAASVRLAEKPTTVLSIVDDDGNADDVTAWTVVGNTLMRPRRTRRKLSQNPRPYWLTVTYVASAGIPPGVVSAVASIVARYIRLSETVGPSAGAAVEMGAGAYRATLAEWTTQSVHLTAEDIATARAYSDPQKAPIVTAT